jgi:HPt (histidine-containing phosphotransfer) domain-containing protein
MPAEMPVEPAVIEPGFIAPEQYVKPDLTALNASAGFWASVSAAAGPDETTPAAAPTADPFDSVAPPALEPERPATAVLPSAFDPLAPPVTAGSSGLPAAASLSSGVPDPLGAAPGPAAPIFQPLSAAPAVEPAAPPAAEVPLPELPKPKDRAEVFRATRAALDDIFAPKTAAAAPVEPGGRGEARPQAAPRNGTLDLGDTGAQAAEALSATGQPAGDAADELVRRFVPAPQESLLEQVGYVPAGVAQPALPEAQQRDPLAPFQVEPVEADKAEYHDMPEGLAPPGRSASLNDIFGESETDPAAAAAVAAEARPGPLPAQPAGTALPPPVDIVASIGRIGDAAFWAELITMYRSEVETRLSTAERALRLGDDEALRHEAHTIKGSSAELVLEGMRSYAMQLEKLAQAGDLATAAVVIVDMRSEFERFKAYLAQKRPDLA